MILRGRAVPSFIDMIDLELIKQLAEEELAGTDLFLVYAKVSKDNAINVVIDGDKGVTIENCIGLSRYIEHELDRDEEDFELKVLSSGLEFPFAMLRQYKKYLDKRIAVTLNDDRQIQGVLQEAEKDHIVLLQEIEKIHKKRSKIVQGEVLRIPMTEIKQAKAVIKL